MIAVVAALRRELMYVWRRMRDVSRLPVAPCPAWSGTLGGRRLLVVASGMGEAAATQAMDWVLAQGVGCVLSVGFAGACGELGIGELIVPAWVCDESGTRLELEGKGRLLTVRGIVGPEEERKLDADAVDRETFHVVRRCQGVGVPVGSLRAISDTPARSLSPFLAEVLCSERVRMGALALAVFRRPWLLGDLWRLARDSDAAARSLAEGIERRAMAGWTP